MSETKVVILKIGGSVITDKNNELAARTSVIDRLADETRRASARSLVIVHGGGSFGHPAAQRNAIMEGFKAASQLQGFAETHNFMTVLNGLVMDALITHGVPAVSIMPLSCIITENGRIKTFEDAPVRGLLKLGFCPVLYGDTVLDAELGFTVLSGDQLVSSLAARLNADRIIMGVDVDGLYDADPKVEKNAKPFAHLTLDELKRVQTKFGKSRTWDVTGGMLGKIVEILPALEKGVSVTITNALRPNYVYKALVGEKTDGTVIKKE